MAFLQSLLKINSASGHVGRLLTSRLPIVYSLNSCTEDDLFYIQKRYAKRKGKRIAATREKQRLARQKKEALKNEPPKVWRPKKLLVDKRLNGISNKFNDSDRKDFEEIVDNVYIIDQYKEQKLSFGQALAIIRETHQCTMYDEPDALLEAQVELDLRTKKKTKFVDKFQGIVSFSNMFAFGGKRKVVALCNSEEGQEAAKNAGAELVGSSDIIQMLKAGEIKMDNFDDLVCHGDMFIELASIKKEIGSYFPTKQRGNIGFDMSRLVSHFVNGFEYKLIKDDIELDYGFVQMPVGRINQTDQQLEDNFRTALATIDYNRPAAAPGDFITRVLLLSQPAPEKFAVTFWNHIDGYQEPNLKDEDTKDSKPNDAKKAATSN